MTNADRDGAALSQTVRPRRGRRCEHIMDTARLAAELLSTSESRLFHARFGIDAE